mmetsp:Transcript_107266/g.160436  ORF Transcript_107266/g.160436 Transcript_107266/m.160436 type:complete len:233 (-) Transcript_107266:33-731(-)
MSRCWLMAEGVVALCPWLSKATSEAGLKLADLNLSMNGFGDQGAISVAKLLHILPLHRLNIAGNRVTPNGMHVLSHEVARHEKLNTLNLSMNKIGNEGCEILASALSMEASPRALQVLDISDNGIGPSGTSSIASVIRQPGSQLNELFLNYNLVGNSGAKAAATVLWEANRQRSVRHLGLTSCGIADEGAEAIISALEQSTARQQHKVRVEIRSNKLTEPTRMRLQRLGAIV